MVGRRLSGWQGEKRGLRGAVRGSDAEGSGRRVGGGGRSVNKSKSVLSHLGQNAAAHDGT